MSGGRAAAIFGMLFATAMAMQACHRSAARGSPAAGASLPVVRPDGGGLLLTWIDDKGDFHVETRVADVPLMGRDIVRVEAENGDNASSPDQVVIVDLREVGVDGGYPVRTMARSEFESIAVARRAKSGPTLAGGGAPPVPELDAAASAQEAPDKPPSGVAVIIYGAEWCSACHEAARYLRHKGIAYVEKDVEKDADAAHEMQSKLAKSGLRGGSIPVIDVRGKVMVGFNPAEIDTALGAAL
jgi:glutaredoxin